MRFGVPLLLVLFLPSLGGGIVFGQKKKVDSKEKRPEVLVCSPPGVSVGKTTRVVFRGLKLDQATEVRLVDKANQAIQAKVKVVSKGKATVPNQQRVEIIGDTQVVAEVTIPAEQPSGQVGVVVVTPVGESQPGSLQLDTELVVLEKEPNNGFDQATPLRIGSTAQGEISGVQDVDTYRFEGKVGQTLVVEVLAARLGSGLDSVLTLYDDRKQIVATHDDLGVGTKGATDSRLEVTLKKSGVYYLTVQDAHDSGGPAHVYRLTLMSKDGKRE